MKSRFSLQIFLAILNTVPSSVAAMPDITANCCEQSEINISAAVSGSMSLSLMVTAAFFLFWRSHSSVALSICGPAMHGLYSLPPTFFCSFLLS